MSNKKLYIIIAVFSISLIACIWIIFGRTGESRQLRAELDSAIARSSAITQSARILQDTATELERLYNEDRDIAEGLRNTNSELNRINRELEQNNQRQRDIIAGITSGDLDIDAAIDRIDDGLASSLEIINELKQ